MDKPDISTAEVGQDLSKFTVLVLRGEDIIGTSFAISMDGKLVTCAHVVEAALGKPLVVGDSEEISLLFPQIKEKRRRQAKLLLVFPNYDVAVLELLDKQTPLAPENLAILGLGNGCDGHNFKSYGYRLAGDNAGKRRLLQAEGKILGLTGNASLEDNLPDLNTDELFLQSKTLDSGMSGAAVYDTEKNLVVGIVAEVYDTQRHPDSESGLAVNARILSLPPLKFDLYQGDTLPRTAGQRPNQEAPETPAPTSSLLNYAPNVLEEWVGREDLLQEIWRLYHDASKRLVGMVGFGGEGKTSLARKWLESFMQAHPKIPVFWWSFYENRSSDEFLSAFLSFLGGEALSKETNSASMKANLIGVLLGKQQILFVLDGFEVMQHEDSTDYGTVRNRDLLDMLKYAALNDRRSFGLLTTRAPLLDLHSYNTYQHLDISRLSEADGRALLTRTGVKGSETEMNKLVNAWDGHALTLGLLGKYLSEKFAGNISHVHDIPAPTSDEPLYERVKRVLRRYDDHMSEADKAFMQIFSAFRLPVSSNAFGKVFLTDTGSSINAPLLNLSFWELKVLVDGLVQRGLVRQSLEGSEMVYSTHPLIRAHYAQSLQGDTETHRAIAEHYQANAPEQVRGRVPSLKELQPYIEIVYHLCQAGAYDEAHEIRRERIYRGNERLILHKLGAYETTLDIMLGFFPNRDSHKDPLVGDIEAKRLILANLGFCLQNLGRLIEAINFTKRKNVIAEEMQDWRNASIGCLNLAQLSWNLGKLPEGESFAKQALDFAHRMPAAGDSRKEMERDSLPYLAWVKAQQNQFDGEEGALVIFKAAEAFEKEIDPRMQYLYSGAGIWHSLCLRRTGDFVYAHAVTEANLALSQTEHWQNTESQCERILGDLDVYAGQIESAQKHYDVAFKIVLMIDKLDVRIEAWLGRGLFYAKHKQDGQAALADLEQAMKPIVDSGYRIYEVQCRVALAWAYKNMPKPDITRAKQEAERARVMSIEMNYAWGKEDAEEVLAELNKELN